VIVRLLAGVPWMWVCSGGNDPKGRLLFRRFVPTYR
jgi:hypothetical protein